MEADEWVRLRRSQDRRDYERAAHAELPLATWQRVIEVDPALKFWVAHAKRVPPEMLIDLATDSDVRVRSMVASKRKAPEEALRRLANDRDEAVRAAVARNPGCPTDVLSGLVDDPEPVVRQAARSGR